MEISTSICNLFRPVPLFLNSFAFVFLRLGIVQCCVFLGFLLHLEIFGLATSIPVGIRVLGVKTPYKLNCSREIGHKTKRIPFFTNFYIFTSSPPSL